MPNSQQTLINLTQINECLKQILSLHAQNPNPQLSTLMSSSNLVDLQKQYNDNISIIDSWYQVLRAIKLDDKNLSKPQLYALELIFERIGPDLGQASSNLTQLLAACNQRNLSDLARFSLHKSTELTPAIICKQHDIAPDGNDMNSIDKFITAQTAAIKQYEARALELNSINQLLDSKNAYDSINKLRIIKDLFNDHGLDIFNLDRNKMKDAVNSLNLNHSTAKSFGWNNSGMMIIIITVLVAAALLVYMYMNELRNRIELERKHINMLRKHKAMSNGTAPAIEDLALTSNVSAVVEQGGTDATENATITATENVVTEPVVNNIDNVIDNDNKQIEKENLDPKAVENQNDVQYESNSNDAIILAQDSISSKEDR